MVWLGAYGNVGPLGNVVVSPTIDGQAFDLYSGKNGAMTVYSFKIKANDMAFSGDLLDFIKYLITNKYIASSQYLLSVQAGSEVFTGNSSTFATSAYSVAVV